MMSSYQKDIEAAIQLMPENEIQHINTYLGMELAKLNQEYENLFIFINE